MLVASVMDVAAISHPFSCSAMHNAFETMAKDFSAVVNSRTTCLQLEKEGYSADDWATVIDSLKAMANDYKTVGNGRM